MQQVNGSSPTAFIIEPVYYGPVLFQYSVDAFYFPVFPAISAVVEHGSAFTAAESLVRPSCHRAAAVGAQSSLLIHTASVMCLQS